MSDGEFKKFVKKLIKNKNEGVDNDLSADEEEWLDNFDAELQNAGRIQSTSFQRHQSLATVHEREKLIEASSDKSEEHEILNPESSSDDDEYYRISKQSVKINPELEEYIAKSHAEHTESSDLSSTVESAKEKSPVSSKLVKPESITNFYSDKSKLKILEKYIGPSTGIAHLFDPLLQSGEYPPHVFTEQSSEDLETSKDISNKSELFDFPKQTEQQMALDLTTKKGNKGKRSKRTKQEVKDSATQTSSKECNRRGRKSTSRATESTSGNMASTSRATESTSGNMASTSRATESTSGNMASTSQATESTSGNMASTSRATESTSGNMASTSRPTTSTSRTSQASESTSGNVASTSRPTTSTSRGTVPNLRTLALASRPTTSTSRGTVPNLRTLASASRPTASTSQPIVSTSQPIASTSQGIVQTFVPTVPASRSTVTAFRPAASSSGATAIIIRDSASNFRTTTLICQSIESTSQNAASTNAANSRTSTSTSGGGVLIIRNNGPNFPTGGSTSSNTRSGATASSSQDTTSTSETSPSSRITRSMTRAIAKKQKKYCRPTLFRALRTLPMRRLRSVKNKVGKVILAFPPSPSDGEFLVPENLRKFMEEVQAMTYIPPNMLNVSESEREDVMYMAHNLERILQTVNNSPTKEEEGEILLQMANAATTEEQSASEKDLTDTSTTPVENESSSERNFSPREQQKIPVKESSSSSRRKELKLSSRKKRKTHVKKLLSPNITFESSASTEEEFFAKRSIVGNEELASSDSLGLSQQYLDSSSLVFDSDKSSALNSSNQESQPLPIEQSNDDDSDLSLIGLFPESCSELTSSVSMTGLFDETQPMPELQLPIFEDQDLLPDEQRPLHENQSSERSSIISLTELLPELSSGQGSCTSLKELFDIELLPEKRIFQSEAQESVYAKKFFRKEHENTNSRISLISTEQDDSDRPFIRYLSVDHPLSFGNLISFLDRQKQMYMNFEPNFKFEQGQDEKDLLKFVSEMPKIEDIAVDILCEILFGELETSEDSNDETEEDTPGDGITLRSEKQLKSVNLKLLRAKKQLLNLLRKFSLNEPSKEKKSQISKSLKPMRLTLQSRRKKKFKARLIKEKDKEEKSIVKQAKLINWPKTKWSNLLRFDKECVKIPLKKEKVQIPVKIIKPIDCAMNCGRKKISTSSLTGRPICGSLECSKNNILVQKIKIINTIRAHWYNYVNTHLLRQIKEPIPGRTDLNPEMNENESTPNLSDFSPTLDEKNEPLKKKIEKYQNKKKRGSKE